MLDPDQAPELPSREWRLLDPDERVQDGDQFYHDGEERFRDAWPEAFGNRAQTYLCAITKRPPLDDEHE